MKLIEAHATNYRNIMDSNPVDIGQTTCLVGKNEAGKSAFLRALEGLRSTDPEFTEYGKITNYPRRAFAEYETTHGDAEACVIKTVWKLEPADVKALEVELGAGALTDETITIEKTYEQTSSSWTVSLDRAVALENLITRHALTADDKAVLGTAKTTEKAAEALTGLASRTPPQQALLDAITGFRGNSGYLRAIDLLNARAPKFMYFSHYDRMSGELSINKLNSDRQDGQAAIPLSAKLRGRW